MGLTWRLLQEVWGHREGYVFLPTKQGGQWREEYAVEWPVTIEQVKVHPATRDVYFSPLVFSEPHRRAQHALPTHTLWADLDEADPAKCALKPSAAWLTTQGVLPHWQALWFLGETHYHLPDAFGKDKPYWNRTEIPAAQAAALSKRVAYGEAGRGADKSGWDITQVLRLPGTYNHKHSPPHKIDLLWAERRYYTIEEVEAAYPPVPVTQSASSDWSDVSAEEVERALKALPVGVRTALMRSSAGADRSLELVKLARDLLSFAPPEVVPHLLRLSPLNKYRGRSDERERILTAVADGILYDNKGRKVSV